MIEKKKLIRPPSNVVYTVDGASYGLDDRLVEAIRASIGRRLQSKTLDIPRLPQVAGRILQLSQSPDADIDEVVKTISTDPLLATRVLTVANSAAYGTGGSVGGLKPALMRLGIKTIRDMVFAESIRLKVFSARSYRSLLEQSWKLSLGTAVACEALSRATGLEREVAFLLGLLHDTGKPVLVNAVVELERENQGRSFGEDTVEILMSQLHEEIGAYVLDQWNMPPAVVIAAGGHHRYARPTNATNAHRLVYAANLVCRHLGIGDVQKDVDFTIEHVFADLNLADTERISSLLEDVSSEIENLMTGLQDAA